MCLGQLNWVNWIIRFKGLEIVFWDILLRVSLYGYKSEKDKDQPHSMRSRARRVQMSKHKLRSICIYHLKSEIIVCRAVRPRGRGPWDSNELPTLYAGHVITFVTWIRVPNLTLTRALLKFNWKFSSEIYTLVPIGHQPDVNKWQNQETIGTINIPRKGIILTRSLKFVFDELAINEDTKTWLLTSRNSKEMKLLTWVLTQIFRGWIRNSKERWRRWTFWIFQKAHRRIKRKSF